MDQYYPKGDKGSSLYAILDFIVDNYSPVLETIQEEVEAMEAQVLASAMTRAQIERLYLLRRDLLRLRNAVGPLVEVCRRLEHDNLPMVRPTMQPLFRGVTDHVRTVKEQIELASRGLAPIRLSVSTAALLIRDAVPLSPAPRGSFTRQADL